MPNRIIREGILDSKRIASLSEGGELFYRRLMSVVDDFGRFEADPDLLLAKAYPLRSRGESADMVDAYLRECTSGEYPLIVVYKVGRKQYLEIVEFGQRIRSEKSKYPGPDEAIHCAVVKENVVAMSADCGGWPQVAARASDTTTSTATPPNTATAKTEDSSAEKSYEPTDDEVVEFSDWVEVVYERHPKHSQSVVAKNALKDRFARDKALRIKFDAWHIVMCKHPDWTKNGGSFAPKLADAVQDWREKDEPMSVPKPAGSQGVFDRLIAEAEAEERLQRRAS